MFIWLSLEDIFELVGIGGPRAFRTCVRISAHPATAPSISVPQSSKAATIAPAFHDALREAAAANGSQNTGRAKAESRVSGSRDATKKSAKTQASDEQKQDAVLALPATPQSVKFSVPANEAGPIETPNGNSAAVEPGAVGAGGAVTGSAADVHEPTESDLLPVVACAQPGFAKIAGIESLADAALTGAQPAKVSGDGVRDVAAQNPGADAVAKNTTALSAADQAAKTVADVAMATVSTMPVVPKVAAAGTMASFAEKALHGNGLAKAGDARQAGAAGAQSAKDGVGEVREKRKDDGEPNGSPTSGSSPGTDAGTTPFPAKIAVVQVAADGSTSQPHIADAAIVQQVQASQTAIGGGAATAGLVATPAPIHPGQPQANAGSGNSEGMPGVSSAQLVQSAGRSEMRVGMQSAEFGSISISTSLNHQALSAQISVDHAELGRVLAVHLPAIEQKLGSAYGLQAQVEIRDGGRSASTADYSGQPQQGSGGRSGQESDRGTASGQSGVNLDRIGMLTKVNATLVANTETSRLDIRV